MAAFLVSVGGGAWLSSALPTGAFSSKVEPRLISTANAAPNPTSSRAFPTDEAMLAAVMSAMAEDEPLLRAHLLHDALGKLSSAELSALFRRAVLEKDPTRRGSLLSAVLGRWWMVDPASAAATVRPYRDRFRSVARFEWHGVDHAVNLAWAEIVPDQTLAEAMASPGAPWARALAQAAIASLSVGDPARQLEVLTRLPASRLRSEMCVTAIKSLAEIDCAAAESHLELLPDLRQRAQVQTDILAALAVRDPAAGLVRLAALAPNLPVGTDGIRLATEVLCGAAKKDPQASLAAVEGLPESLRASALGAVLVGWAGENPVDALRWGFAKGVDLTEAKAFLQFGETGGASWQPLLSVAFSRDREKTLEWVRTQPVSAERDSMLRSGVWGGTWDQKLAVYAELTPDGQTGVIGDMLRSLRYGVGGAEGVEPWVKSHPPGATRTAAIREFINYQATNTPERMNELANEWPAGPDRQAALRGVASYLSGANPLQAVEIVRQLNEPAARESTFEGIAHHWLNRDKSAARAWIASSPDLSAEQKRVLLRQAGEQ